MIPLLRTLFSRCVSVSSGSCYSDSTKLITPPLPQNSMQSKCSAIVFTAACFLVMMACEGTTDCFGLIFNQLPDEFNITRTEMSVVPSLLYSLPMFLGPISSGLVQRYGCRAMLALGCFLAGASLCASSQVDVIYVLYASLGLLVGTGLSLCYMVLDISINIRFDAHHLPLIYGITQCGGMFGTIVLSQATSLLNQNYTWRYSLLMYGGLFCALIVFCQALKGLNKLESCRKFERNLARFDDSLGSQNFIQHHESGDLSTNQVRSISSVDLTLFQSQWYFAPHFKSSHRNRTVFFRSQSEPISAYERDPSTAQISTGNQRSRFTKFLSHLTKMLSRFTNQSSGYSLNSTDTRPISLNNLLEAHKLPNIKFRGKFIRQLATVRRLLGFYPLLFFVLSRLLIRAFGETMTLYLPDFVQSEARMSPQDSSDFIMVNGFCGLLGTVIFGCIVLNIQLRYLPFVITGFCNLLAGATLALVNLFPSYIGLLTLSGFWGFVTASYWSLESVLLAAIVPMDFEDACSLIYAAEGIGCLVGPILNLYLRDLTSSYRLVFFVAAAANAVASFLCGLSCVSWIWYSRKRISPDELVIS